MPSKVRYARGLLAPYGISRVPFGTAGSRRRRYQIHTEAIFHSIDSFGEGLIIDQPWISKRPGVTQKLTSPAIKTMNFIVGFALLVMLSPIGGKLPDKPAGVRTALELVDKRGAKPTIPMIQTAALS